MASDVRSEIKEIKELSDKQKKAQDSLRAILKFGMDFLKSDQYGFLLNAQNQVSQLSDPSKTVVEIMICQMKLFKVLDTNVTSEDQSLDKLPELCFSELQSTSENIKSKMKGKTHSKITDFQKFLAQLDLILACKPNLNVSATAPRAVQSSAGTGTTTTSSAASSASTVATADPKPLIHSTLPKPTPAFLKIQEKASAQKKTIDAFKKFAEEKKDQALLKKVEKLYQHLNGGQDIDLSDLKFSLERDLSLMGSLNEPIWKDVKALIDDFIKEMKERATPSSGSGR